MKYLAILLLSTAAFAQTHTVTLTWTPSVQPPTVTNYAIFRSTHCGTYICSKYTKVASVPDPTATYTDTLPTLTSGTKISYALVAVGPTAGSDPATVQVVMP